MTNFRYHGRSNQGQAIIGELESVSVDAVASHLLGKGITPVKIEEVTKGASYLKTVKRMLGYDRVRTVDLIMFCRQMYTLTKAGIPLTRGIRGLSASIRNEFFQQTLMDVAERLEAGNSLSQAMRHHPKVFDNLFVNMISVGENSGKLDKIFEQIGYYLERDEETRKRIRSALRYPSFVMLALIAAITVVNILVIPAFARLFEKFNAELPFVTKILIVTSDIFVYYWPYLLLTIGTSVFVAWRFLKTEQGAYSWSKKKFNLPVVGELIERAYMARYARSFSLMLAAGVPITQALSLCAAAMGSPYLSLKIMNIKQGIERGESILRTHMQAEVFTPLVLQMVTVGEESGQIEELLQEVAEFYEREVDYDLKTLTDRIEPLLIIIMAVFVTVLALGIFLPMWSLYEVQT